MKEITRIHIAKNPYDIEIDAKKALQKYINRLESYTDDAELLEDVEIRVTELLAERGIDANGVITSEDVTAIRTQLGEPEEFLEEGDIAVGKDVRIEGDEPSRKLYRDKDEAILGGVMSGAAHFFGISPIWTRLAFIVLTLFSFGTFALIYIVLWIVVPAAHTAAEKLQMNRQPVTLGSLRDQSEKDERREGVRRRASSIRHGILVAFGIMSLLAAVVTLFALAWGIIATLRYGGDSEMATGLSIHAPLVVTAIIAAISGLVLLTALFVVWAYAAFSRSYSKRLTIMTIVIIVLGFVSAGVAASSVAYETWQKNLEIEKSITLKTKPLEPAFSNVKQLTLEAGSEGSTTGVLVNYVVSDAFRYELQALPGVNARIAIEGTSAKISINTPKFVQYYSYQPQLTIYGPALDSFDARVGQVSYTNNSPQKNFTVTSSEAAGFGLYGSYENVSAKGASVELSGSSIVSLTAETDKSGDIRAGTVRNLTIIQDDVCPDNGGAYSYDGRPRLVVRSVVTNTMNYNGADIPAQTHKTACGIVVIGDESQLDEDF